MIRNIALADDHRFEQKIVPPKLRGDSVFSTLFWKTALGDDHRFEQKIVPPNLKGISIFYNIILRCFPQVSV